MAAAGTPDHAMPAGTDRHGRELFWNHLWESLNAATRILLFALVTPLMLRGWGKESFGLFAIANSCIALTVFLDFGLRTLTRVGLSRRDLPETERVRLHARHVAAFGLVAGSGLVVIWGLAWSGALQRWLNLPAGGGFVLASTATLALTTMVLQLLLERIAAAGRLSRIKAAVFAGNIVATILVLILLKRAAGVAAVTISYFAALGLPLLFLLPQAGLRSDFLAAVVRLKPRELFSAFRPGLWINAITGSWLLQSYGLVFLVSWVSSPAEAGRFFLYLKLSEIISVLGASASEPTIAALAGGVLPTEQRQRLATGYRSAVALSLAGAVGCAFFCADLFRLWLGAEIAPWTGLFIGLLGASSAFSRMVTAASLGLARPRPAALGAMAGAVVMVLAVVLGYEKMGALLALAAGAGAGLFFLPVAVLVARALEGSFGEIWWRPVVRFAPSLGGILLVCGGASYFHSFILMLGAIAVSAGLALRHALGGPAPRYDTRSRRSALVMRVIGLLNPWRKVKPFRWSGPCVVSSLAGLGDLFIQLPLIAGLVAEARRHGIEARVALRPAHVQIGVACGWEVVPFDNALEDFFKNPRGLRLGNLWRGWRAARRQRASLWIDLTGNAVSALAIKFSGAHRVAARTTRGGESLIDHPLPHVIGENEYENAERVGAFLRSEPDRRIFQRLRGAPLLGLQETLVLCLTTACRWRSWPLKNFLALVDRFPETRFVASGLRSEVAPGEEATLERILSRPNVTSRLDALDLLELVRLIAHARAVVTNDTSTAHLANGFEKPGAALFGPASPDKFGADFGLRNFVDRTCPLHPCVQWTCGNQANWCMEKITAAEVGEHLGTILESVYAATARVA